MFSKRNKEDCSILAGVQMGGGGLKSGRGR